MAASGKPWEKYAPAPAATGKPWEKYAASQATTSEQSAKKPAAPKAFSAEDLKRVPQTFTAGVLQGLGGMGATLLAPFDYLVPEEYGGRPNRRAEITNALSEMYQPSSTGVSGFAGGVGNVLPIVAGTAGLSAPVAVGQRGLGAAIATGGLSRAAANFPTRIAGGSLAGAASAGYVNPNDMATGAAIGAALPVVGAVAGQTVGKLLEAYNALGPGAAKARVGEMLRQAAGSRAEAIQAAQTAQPNQLASLASAEAATPGYQALMSIGQRFDNEGASYFAIQGTKQAERAALSGAAGGSTQTEALAGRKAMKEELQARTGVQREEALGLADLYRKEGRPLEEAASEASAASRLAADDVRRFGKVSDDVYFPYRDQPRVETPDILGGRRAEAPGVQERANEMARTWEPSSGATFAGQPRPPVQSTYPGELAKRAEEFATARAGESRASAETARELEARLASMKEAGLKPLRPDAVISVIKRKLATPEGRLNSDANRVLNKVLDMFESSKTKHGDIRSDDMYAISKYGVSSAIEELMRGSDPAAKKRVASEITGSLKDVINNAIEEAGGKGWGDYRRAFEKGMGDIERKELLAKAMELYDTNPNQFQRLIEAESPDVVEGILGYGKYDVLKELTGEIGPLENIVANMRTRNLAAEKAGEGVDVANKLIAASEKNVRIPNFFSPKVTLTNEVLKGLEGKISADALEVLAQATRSGKAANEAMAVLSPVEQSKVVQFVRQYVARNPKLRNILAAAPKIIAAARPGAVAGVATNALSPPTQNALAEQ
jgi:hypothetical protein